MRGARLMPKGVPACPANSTPCGPWRRASANSALGWRRTKKGRCLSVVTTRCRAGSHAMLPQFIPPAMPGHISVPSVLGGVKIPS